MVPTTELGMRSERTRRRRDTPSLPVRIILENADLKKRIARSCLYQGVGTDVAGLRALGAVGYDPYMPMFSDREVLKKKYSCVLSAFVVNVLPKHDRIRAYWDMVQACSRSGCVVVAARSLADVALYGDAPETAVPFEDGYRITRTNTFQRGYLQSELEDEMGHYFGKVERVDSPTTHTHLVMAMGSHPLGR